jgi:hypothetical protein
MNGLQNPAQYLTSWLIASSAEKRVERSMSFLSGWWFGTFGPIFPFSWECHKPT